MAIVSLDCPNCGAKLPPREDTGRTRCEYCGATFETARAPHHPQLPNPTAAAAPAVRSALLLGVGVSVAMVLLGTVLFLGSAPSGPAHIMPMAAEPLAVEQPGKQGAEWHRQLDGDGSRPGGHAGEAGEHQPEVQASQHH